MNIEIIASAIVDSLATIGAIILALRARKESTTVRKEMTVTQKEIISALNLTRRADEAQIKMEALRGKRMAAIERSDRAIEDLAMLTAQKLASTELVNGSLNKAIGEAKAERARCKKVEEEVAKEIEELLHEIITTNQ